MKVGLTQRVLTHNGEVYDSLDHNWYRLLESHELLPIPNREDLDYESLAESLDLLIITGGGNEQIRISTEISLCAEMSRLEKPILGICHGAFLLTEVLGGSTKECEGHYNTEHLVYGDAPTHVRVNSFHNISIDKSPKMGYTLYIDDEGNIESWIKGNMCAIVWHPERMSNPFIPSEIRKVTGL
jgi:gamma-glutamyl-gamma-aminobutyrate hydrolase PuuD